jgi:hypothetical protein
MSTGLTEVFWNVNKVNTNAFLTEIPDNEYLILPNIFDDNMFNLRSGSSSLGDGAYILQEEDLSLIEDLILYTVKVEKDKAQVSNKTLLEENADFEYLKRI